MAKLTFKTDLCKGCGLCVDACPKKILALALFAGLASIFIGCDDKKSAESSKEATSKETHQHAHEASKAEESESVVPATTETTDTSATTSTETK